MSVIRQKVWSDLWKNKLRSLQVALIIGMGAFAVGMILGSRDLIHQSLSSTWQAAAPAMIYLQVDPPVNDETIQTLENVRGVTAVEGYLSSSIEWRFGPNEPWQAATLVARDDYQAQKYLTLKLTAGQWPERKDFAVLQGIEAYYGIGVGSRLEVRVGDHVQTVDIVGEAYNPLGLSPALGGNPEFYTTRERFGQLTGDRGFNRLMAAASTFEPETVGHVADQMQEKLEKLDIRSFGEQVPGRVVSPERHFMQDLIDGLFFILGLMAVITLLLGLLLVYNTINAVITQQVNQIGVMKAIGASTWQIMSVYLLLVLVYGLLALLISVPLGALGAYGMSSFILSAFNVAAPPFSISATAMVAQVLIALLAPLLASLLPVLFGARVTVQEAISTYGLATADSWLTRWLAKFEETSRLLLLTINNTFRNTKRMLLTQVTLVGSGMIFMMVMGVLDSALYTYDDLLFDVLRFNVSLQFESPERIAEIEAVTLAQPDVAAVEMWALQNAEIRFAGQPESPEDENIVIFGVPLPTQLYGSQIRTGRWLLPQDEHAVVLNQKVAQKIGVTVGDQVTLAQNSYGDSQWQVVGLLFDPGVSEAVYVPRHVLLRETHSVGKASTVWVQTVDQTAEAEAAAAMALRKKYEALGLSVAPQSVFGNDTASQIIAQIHNNFIVVISLLAAIAVVMGIVGAVGLSGALSLSVAERRREIGVMRAIGASSFTIALLFVGEGLVMGLLSWVVALPLSIPAGYLMSSALGTAIEGEIVFHYTPTGALLWLVIVISLAIIASWLPARHATQISVRESLAYQ